MLVTDINARMAVFWLVSLVFILQLAKICTDTESKMCTIRSLTMPSFFDLRHQWDDVWGIPPTSLALWEPRPSTTPQDLCEKSAKEAVGHRTPDGWKPSRNNVDLVSETGQRGIVSYHHLPSLLSEGGYNPSLVPYPSPAKETFPLLGYAKATGKLVCSPTPN